MTARHVLADVLNDGKSDNTLVDRGQRVQSDADHGSVSSLFNVLGGECNKEQKYYFWKQLISISLLKAIFFTIVAFYL